MPAPLPNSPIAAKQFEPGTLVPLAYLFGILSVFVWAKEFLLPLILAVLISFLLAPVVSRLERWRFPRAIAVLSVVAIVFAVIGLLCSTLSLEALDVVNALPKYRENIRARWEAIQKGPPGPLNLAFHNVDALITDLGKVTASAGDAEKPAISKVQIVSSGTDDIVAILKNSLMPVAAPIGEVALVFVLVVFMLLERKRLGIRFLRLTGHSHVASTTLAVDEVGSKLSRFLLGQLVVNTGYALLLGIGLFLIRIPNALLWAVLTLVLRFLPYIGLWISAFFPLLFSIAISTNWTAPILTFALYGTLEVLTNNLVEPFVLGGSTGLSPLAVIVSAMFWTWLWGPIGLLLATPLSAGLVVLGRYFPAFHVCTVLLAADPPSSSETRFILLLTENRFPEAKAFIEELGRNELSAGIAEELILPTVRAIENELYPGATGPTKSRIYAQLTALIEEMTVEQSTESEQPPEGSTLEHPGTVIVPFLGECDEIVGTLVFRLLAAKGIATNLLSWRMLIAEKVERLKELKASRILLSAAESKSVTTIGRMAHSIKLELPDALILVGLWSLPAEGAARWVKRIKDSSGSEIYTNIDEAVRGIASLARPSTIELSGESQTGVKTMRCGDAAAGHPQQMDPANK
jgi:predicted PurR-regulated permease PerM